MPTDRSKFVPHTYCLAIVRPGEIEPWAQHWSATPFQSFNVGDGISAYTYGDPSKSATGFPPGERNVKHEVGRIVREVSTTDEVLDTTWIYLVPVKL